MADILLTSEARIKDFVDISDNTAGKQVNIAIRTAQDIYFRTVIGDALFDKLCDLVAEGTISQTANAKYKTLLDKAQPLLCWRAAQELLDILPLKVGNIGVVKASDENLQPASNEDIVRRQANCARYADFYTKRLQGWLLDNRADYPELSDNQCHAIRSNLYSAASCGIWMGGPRGKGVTAVHREGYDK